MDHLISIWLHAYGPESSHGKANIEQNLFDNNDENFWNFSLQPEFLNSNPNSGSNPGPNPSPGLHVHAIALQMASYFVMPNALFYTGLTDMAKQNVLLANRRISLLGKEQEKQSGFFLYTPMEVQETSPLKVLLVNMVIAVLIFTTLLSKEVLTSQR